jgi:hypothetical protein
MRRLARLALLCLVCLACATLACATLEADKPQLLADGKADEKCVEKQILRGAPILEDIAAVCGGMALSQAAALVEHAKSADAGAEGGLAQKASQVHRRGDGGAG